MARVLTPQADDFPRWYQDVLAKAELAENGPVRGTMVIRPDGYALWERMQSEVDDRIKAAGARNAYFPLFIPESYLRREAEHVEGFSPELAVVTIGGGKELEEPVIVRPTSETIINASFAKWVQSYRDLPLLINQWANVVRWEMRPRLFLRTSEFLWQEGHTAHATEDDARVYAQRILRDVYQDFMVDVLALPVPPRLAPTQVAVVLIKAEAGEAAAGIAGSLRDIGVRVELDDRADVPFGRRAVDWELKGVPIRVEAGPRDLAEGNVTLVRRIPGTKTPTALAAVADAVRVALVEDQVAL